MTVPEIVRWPPEPSLLFLLPALFLGFTVHELGHALVAYLLGDTSQVERKRLSFNPLRHVSWVGMAAFLLIGIGWAKPVSVDHSRFRLRNRALGVFLVAIAGSLANLLLAALTFAASIATTMIVSSLTGQTFADVFLFIFSGTPEFDAVGVALAVSGLMVTVNGLLALFNLLPFPLFDGFQAVVSLLGAISYAVKNRPTEKSWPAPAAAVAPTGEARSQTPAEIHFAIGVEYQKEGQWDEAIARYRQALAHDPQIAAAYYNQGLAYWSKGRPRLARSAFKAASQSGRDAGVRIQAELRLRDLAEREQTPGKIPFHIPKPLEPGQRVEAPRESVPPVDPTVARRVWTHLTVGAVGLLGIGMVAWIYSVIVLVSSLGA